MIDKVSFLAVSTTGIRRFNKFKKKNHNKLMLDNIEPQMVGKMSYDPSVVRSTSWWKRSTTGLITPPTRASSSLSSTGALVSMRLREKRKSGAQ